MAKSVLIITRSITAHKKFSVSSVEILKDCLEREGVKTSLSSRRQNRIVMLLDMLVSIIRARNSCDIVIINVFSGKAFIWAYLSARLCCFLKKPYVLHFHGGNLPIFAEKYTNLIKIIVNHSTCTIAPSRYLKDELENRGISIKKIIPNFIDLKKYTHKLRKRIYPKIFWLRAYHNIYNPEMALKVFCVLKKSYPQANLTMAGSDKGGLQRTKIEAKKLGIHESVRFLDFISKEEINSLGQEHDIFLNTTRIDNMPVTVLESMAMGLPVVSTNVGGISYLLENEKDSLLVSEKEPQNMVEAIVRLLSNPELAEALAINARKKVQRFTWEEVKDSWFKVLNLNKEK